MVETISDTRAALTTVVARFRKEGAQAEPVVFGDHRKPEAVLLSYETYQILLDVAEDVMLTRRAQERLAEDDETRMSLAEVADLVNLDLDSL